MPDFIANATTQNDQTFPAITTLPDGRVVAVWRSNDTGDGSGSNIRARIYDPANPGAATDFIVNTTTAGDQSSPAVAALPDGRIMFTWASGDPFAGEVRARLYDPANPGASTDFLVPTSAADTHVTPSVAALPDGRVVFTWLAIHIVPNGNTTEIRGRIYDPANPGASSNFIVESGGFVAVDKPDVAALPDGRIVFTWTSHLETVVDEDFVRARLYNSNGTPAAAAFPVSEEEFGDGEPAVTALGDGRLVFVWPTAPLGGSDIRARFYDPANPGASSEFVVNTTTTGVQDEADVTLLPGGLVLFVWRSNDTGDGSSSCIRARVVDPANVAASTDFIVNTTAANAQTLPSVTTLPDGRVALVWRSDDPGDGSGSNIRSLLLAPAGLGSDGNDFMHVAGDGETAPPGYQDLVVATAASDVLAGLAGADIILAGGGDDSVDGGAGDDTLEGQAGDDLLAGGAGIDTASYASAPAGVTVFLTLAGAQGTAGAGLDTLSGIENLGGSAFADALVGDAGVNSLDGGGGDDVLEAGAGDDALTGGDGKDTLDGKAGDDTMAGGDGNDGFRGGAGADSHDGGAGIDAVNYAASAGVDVFLDGSGTNGGGAAGDTFLDVENVVGSVTGADLVVGSGASNRLTGNGGADVLQGLAAIDQLEGGAGSDRLVGGAGNDALVGGADADTFVFDLAPAAGGIDRTTDFAAGTDEIEIDASAFGGGLVAGGAVQFTSGSNPSSAGFVGGVFLYDTNNGFLSWDADGQGAGAAVAFFRLQNLPALTAADFVVVA